MKQVGLIGYPVAHSLSPAMQQAAFDACGVEARYALWETPPGTLPARIASLRAAEVLGANVTIPYKVDVVPLIDDYDPLAARVGAVNTIVNRNGRLTGYNTDVYGFIHALNDQAGHLFAGQRLHAGIIGTGGAARAAAVGLLEPGARRRKIAAGGCATQSAYADWDEVEDFFIGVPKPGITTLTLLGRSQTHLTQLQHALQGLAEGLPGTPTIDALLLGSAEVTPALARADLLVNATPVGLYEDEQRPPIEIGTLAPGTVVMDMIFNPPQTLLLHAAQARGCQTLNGLTMLLYQGVRAFELWTGLPAPVERMRKALGC